MIAINDIRKTFQTSTQETVTGMVSKMSQAVEALRPQEIRLPDMQRFVKQVKAVPANVWLSSLVTLLAVLPSILLTWKPMVGAYGVVLSLISLLTIALKHDKLRKLALSASILPVALMFMAVYPYNPNPFYRSWVEYDVVLLLAGSYGYMFREKLTKKNRLKLKQLPQVLPMMVIIGELLGVAGYGLLRNHYDFKGVSLPFVASVVVTFAFAEELLFRGLIQRQAMKLTNKWFATTLTVVVYSAASIGMGSLLPVVFSVLSAAVLSAVYGYKQNLVLTGTANIAMKLTYVGLVASFILR